VRRDAPGEAQRLVDLERAIDDERAGEAELRAEGLRAGARGDLTRLRERLELAEQRPGVLRPGTQRRGLGLLQPPGEARPVGGEPARGDGELAQPAVLGAVGGGAAQNVAPGASTVASSCPSATMSW
jgi:hypothetical protein